MKVDVTKELLLRNGEPIEKPLSIIGGEVVKKENFTFKTAVIDALETMVEEDKGINATVKRQRGKLADKIYDGKGEVEFTIDEMKLIKDRVGQVCVTVILNLIYDILGED